jgi:hypothetical protein
MGSITVPQGVDGTERINATPLNGFTENNLDAADRILTTGLSFEEPEARTIGYEICPQLDKEGFRQGGVPIFFTFSTVYKYLKPIGIDVCYPKAGNFAKPKTTTVNYFQDTTVLDVLYGREKSSHLLNTKNRWQLLPFLSAKFNEAFVSSLNLLQPKFHGIQHLVLG